MWLWWQKHWAESLLCLSPRETRHSWWFSQSETHTQALPCTQTHPNKPHTHSLTHEHKLPMGLRREWDESGLVFHVWCEGFPASLLFGRLLCFRHTGNGSGSSEALLLFSSTNTNWHLLLPPTHSWCHEHYGRACFCFWPDRGNLRYSSRPAESHPTAQTDSSRCIPSLPVHTSQWVFLFVAFVLQLNSAKSQFPKTLCLKAIE